MWFGAGLGLRRGQIGVGSDRRQETGVSVVGDGRRSTRMII